MENCRPAIIVNFGVAARWSSLKWSEGAAGIDSWQSFVGSCTTGVPMIRNTSPGPPQTGGPGGGDFILPIPRHSQSVPDFTNLYTELKTPPLRIDTIDVLGK
jgi:hypothetical protein